ncbi:hypothetical protein R3W88_018921 [Solanum pinnatisectum]|uniref:Uncharacterized protein n=1 Tax=Solanum pinnatisectum TaxID=50273 RepID=A0AAV9KKC4_9SOLN|nr:hypothetical protein R3W88_018921 [Solanum pinnatisectum]
MASSKSQPPKRICYCSPTTHPGSFRCKFHKNGQKSSYSRRSSSSSSYLELAKIAKAKSLKVFLLQIIKPSSHDLQRIRNFQPKPSRFIGSINNINQEHGVIVS